MRLITQMRVGEKNPKQTRDGAVLLWLHWIVLSVLSVALWVLSLGIWFGMTITRSHIGS